MDLQPYFAMVPVVIAKIVREGRSDLERLDQSDIKQDACLAIIERAARYDPSRYESPETYFALVIRGAVLDSLKRERRHQKGRVPISKAMRFRDFAQRTTCGPDV